MSSNKDLEQPEKNFSTKVNMIKSLLRDHNFSLLYPTLCDPMDYNTQASLSFPISRSLFKLMSIESMMPSDHLFLCCPLFFQLSIFSSIRVLISACDSSSPASHMIYSAYKSNKQDDNIQPDILLEHSCMLV